MSKYISLNNHTHYSILQSLSSPKDLFNRAKELNIPALGINDFGSMAGIWDSFKVAKEVGVKLIPGCEMYFTNDVQNKEEKFRFIILLAKNHIGYKNLLKLNRLGFEHSSIIFKKVIPVIDWKLLTDHAEGLICLTGCGNGIVGALLNERKFEEGEETFKKLVDIFGENLGAEIQANNLRRNETKYNVLADQRFTNIQIIRLAEKYNVRIVPTSNSLYLKKEDADTHDTLLAVGSGMPKYLNNRIKYNTDELYLKSYEEIKTFFGRNYSEEFIEKICGNTIWFGEKCEDPKWIDPKYTNPDGKELPLFPVEKEDCFNEFKIWAEKQSEDIKKLSIDKQYLRYQCELTFSSKVFAGKEKEYRERLNEELDVLEYQDFSSYMLIVSDYISWAKKNNIRVGAGRGSVGGSLVAYLLGIHQADPIKYKLIFARFQNKERTAPPDIDTDFSSLGRDRVQEYIRNKYGKDYVAHVSNLNTITPKVFVRDIARSCEIGGNRQEAVRIGNEVADVIPNKIDEKDIKTYNDAFTKSPLFVEYTKKHIEYSKYSDICGQYRAYSTHAGGIVIGKRKLVDIVPLRKDKDNSIAIELDKNAIEENSLVKMDTLAVSTLDIIDDTYKLIKDSGKESPPDPPNFEEYDKKTYDLISNGDTVCVFQLGKSSGMMDLCKKVKPKSIEDISHINSLARPSARSIREDFIKTKEGSKKMQLMHPSLERAFGFTFGFGLYEESLLYLAQDIAGWGLHKADGLRKMTKDKGKNPQKVKKLREDFIECSIKNNIPENVSIKIWDDVIEKFQGYGFNLSHSILYSMISYHTAYLKAHYPIEFLLAHLMHETKSNTPIAKENIIKIKQELRKFNIRLLPPDINLSNFSYKIVNGNCLLTGLNAIESVGDDAIKDIIEKRPFKDFYDFMIRVNGSKVRANTIQALAASGCFDSFGLNRKIIFQYSGDYKKKLQTWLKKHNPVKEQFNYVWAQEEDWKNYEKFSIENKYLGQSFISKKDAWNTLFDGRSLTVENIKGMENKDRVNRFVGEIKSIFEFKVKKEESKLYGKNMIKAVLEDEFNKQISLTIFPEQLINVKSKAKDYKCQFEPGYAVALTGSANIYEGETGIILNELYEIKSPPALPKDLKEKKISSKKIKEKNNIELTQEVSEEIKSIEDELFDVGKIELDTDIDND